MWVIGATARRPSAYADRTPGGPRNGGENARLGRRAVCADQRSAAGDGHQRGRRPRPGPDDRLLDVGCGDGLRHQAARRNACQRARGGRRRVAADDREGRHGVVECAVRAGDARDLPFRAEFDVVVSFNALHWVVEQQRALGSIAAAARPDARA
ncbi:methyltransferase domain-containing protein [Rhodococcus hoagii]|nr:methyltransferase domain-containing protein [Prescottella equi]